LWVEEKRRHQGLGTKLFNELEKFAISKNCKMLQLYTTEFQAKKFYEKIGFSIAAILENAFMGHSVYTMRKLL
jgi:ribosomal protein S18 acetylase RimI-like enzyme